MLAALVLRDRLMGRGLTVNTTTPATTDQMWKSIAADYRAVGETL